MRLRPVTFRRPLRLASGLVSEVDEARVTVTVENRVGERATGEGSVLLSHPWAFGGGRPDPEGDARLMAEAVARLAAEAVSGDWADPFEHGDRLQSDIDLPRLAGLVCLAPIDGALHDAWARAAGRDAYDLYGPEYVSRDLGDVFGPSLRGRYVGDYLRPSDPAVVPVSHVVGLDDPPDEVADAVRRDQVRWLKLKVSCTDPAATALRVAQVWDAAGSALQAPVRLSVDGNEDFEDVETAAELWNRLRTDHPTVAESVAYLEQPFPRDRPLSEEKLHDLAQQVPVLLDEGLDEVTLLPQLVAQGWSGPSVKTGRTHSQALRAAAYAAHHGLPLAIHDLTNVGRGVVHAARLAGRLPLTFPALEYNSRDLAPDANAAEAGRQPDLFAVRGGQVSLADVGRLGLY